MDSNKTVSLTFSLGDLPMIAHAFSIGRATAMMCGHKFARERFGKYLEIIKALLPAGCEVFEPEHWAEICDCIGRCKEWSVYITKQKWDRRVGGSFEYGGKIEICIDGKTWRNEFHHTLGDKFSEESPQFIAVKEFLSELSAMDSKEAAPVE